MGMELPTAWPPPKLWRVPPFAFAGTDSHEITESDLRGHVWIADFIFTRCVTMCPIITAEMNVLRRSIRSADLRFVSFSVEPEYDTPAVLNAYARTWGADQRWLLLSPPPGTAIEFAKAMTVPFERTSMPDEPILHTTLFFLVDPEGWVRGVYGSLDTTAVRRLADDAVRLEANNSSGAARPAVTPYQGRAPLETDVSHGRVLYRALACGACHENPKLAPALGGLWGRTVRLEGEATSVADDSYLRESLLEPGARVVAGYNALMPAYRDLIAPADVDALVAYMRSLDVPVVGGAAAPEAAESDVEDPVCGMRLKPARAEARVDDHRRTFYFCSERCRTLFMREPGRYVRH